MEPNYENSTAAAKGCYWNERPFSNENERNTHNSTLPDINLLSTKNGLDFGVHLKCFQNALNHFEPIVYPAWSNLTPIKHDDNCFLHVVLIPIAAQCKDVFVVCSIVRCAFRPDSKHIFNLVKAARVNDPETGVHEI